MTQRVIGWDVETFPIAPGMPFPQLVCVSFDDGTNTGVMLDQEGLTWFRAQLEDPDVILVAHNASFDILVMIAEDPTLIPLVRKRLLDGGLRCTKVRSKIIDNAVGELKYLYDEELEKWTTSSYRLDRLVLRYFRRKMKKGEEAWQKRFGTLFRVPIAEWPPEAIEYSILDSTEARALFFKGEEIADGDEIPGELHVTRTSIALGGLRSWGVRTDAESVAELEKQITAEYNFWVAKAQGFGLVRAADSTGKRSRDMKVIKARVVKIYTQFGIAVPPTKKFDVCTDRETLTFSGAEAKKLPRIESVVGLDGTMIMCVDVQLKCVSEVVRTQHLLKNFVVKLWGGVKHPVTPNWNEMVETLRTSCSDPNLQNQGRAGGVRRCFVPRGSSHFNFCDYDSLEMRTLAQTCIDLFGYSFIAEAIRAGRDPHVDLATETLGMEYDAVMRLYLAGDERIDNVRQGSKIGNYGLAGAMGPPAFQDYARGYGVDMSLDEATEHYRAYRRKWREMPEYFNYCSNLIGGNEAEQVFHPRTKMVRGKMRYTVLCNWHFQHLAAVGATDALDKVFWETIDSTLESPLYGCRPWYFGHDEIGMENPYTGQRAHDAAMRLQALMIERMAYWVPDVPIGATVCASRRWIKGTKPVYVDGLLVPSRSVKSADGKTLWVADIEEVRRAA